jgi:hypothetical protein
MVRSFSDSEHQFVSLRRGKWSEPNVPHRGWHCVDIEDVGDSLETCGPSVLLP